MIKNIKETLKKVLEFHGVATEISECAFLDYKSIKKMRGIYVIVGPTGAIYVGKGHVKDRQKHHRNKALNNITGGTRDTAGWKNWRENHAVDLASCHLVCAEVNSETGTSAVEGSLIHLLQPLANDECLVDRKKQSKKAA